MKHARPMVACKARTIITILLALVAILYQGTMNKEIIEKIQFVGIG